MKTPKARTTLSQHFRRYAAGNVLSMAAGFVSFPITTRLLSNEQFGVLGYWEVWVLLGTAILKLGAGDTMMRFYPHSQDQAVVRAYGTNFVVVPALLALAGWLILIATTALVGLSGWIDEPAVALLAMVSVGFQVWGSHLSWVMATREMSGLNAIFGVSWRWMVVMATLLVLAFLSASASGVFAARVAVGLAVLAWSLRWISGVITFSREAVDMRRVREGLAYGIPLALKEVSNIILVLNNRVMLKWLVGDFAIVGVYTIGFSLAMYVDQIISSALLQAINPVVTRLYTTAGAASVVQLKQRVLVPLTHACLGTAALIVACGSDFILLVAGAGKSASAPVFVVASVCLLIQPIISIAGLGLLLERRSKTVFALTAVAAVANIVLNLIMIPRWGLMGATYAVCLSQIALQLAFYIYCPRELRCLPPGRSLLIAVGAMGAFLGVCSITQLFGTSAPLARMATAGALFLAVFAAPVWLLDPQLRSVLRRGRSGMLGEA